MPTPNAVHPDNSSFAPRLKTIVKSPEDIAVALQVQGRTAKRIHDGITLILASTRQASQLANDEAAAAMERSEVLNQALLSVVDVDAAMGDYETTLRIDMTAMEEFADSIGGARMWVSNFLTAYVYNHVHTMKEVLDNLNLEKLTIAARDLMKVERVLALIGALLAALPVPIIKYILENATIADINQAAAGVDRNRLSKIVQELTKSAQKWRL